MKLLRPKSLLLALLALLAIVAIFLVGAMTETFEYISMDDWQEVGKPELPRSNRVGNLHVAPNVEGRGQAVKAGDLVKIKILVTTMQIAPSVTPKNRETHIAWLWVGQEPKLDFDSEQMESFGALGSGRVRRTLVGRKLNERFSIQLESGAAGGSTDEIPLRGIIGSRSSQLQRSGYINKQIFHSVEWPGIKLSDDGFGVSSAEIEILNICSAKLFRRTATLRQWGFVFAIGDARYGFNRKGVLGWTAIEAQCPAPDGNVRFQAGPFYYKATPNPPDMLADWSASYIRLRPPKKFPEEWEPAEY